MPLKKNRQRQARAPLKKIFRGAARRKHSRTLEESMLYLSKRGLIAGAAARAIKKQLKNGVPAVWMEHGVIYKVHPNGTREILAKHAGSAHKAIKENYILQIK